MRAALVALYAAILAAMVYLATAASQSENILVAAEWLWPDAWFRATRADACFPFPTFYVWVACEVARWGARAAGLAAILLFGNLDRATHILRELSALPAGRPLSSVLRRR